MYYIKLYLCNVQVESFTGVGVICLFFAIGPLEVPVTSCGSTSVTPSISTAIGGGA